MPNLSLAPNLDDKARTEAIILADIKLTTVDLRAVGNGAECDVIASLFWLWHVFKVLRISKYLE